MILSNFEQFSENYVETILTLNIPYVFQCTVPTTRKELLKMTLSSIEGTFQPPASYKTCLFVGSFFFHSDSENIAVSLLSQSEKRKYKT